MSKNEVDNDQECSEKVSNASFRSWEQATRRFLQQLKVQSCLFVLSHHLITFWLVANAFLPIKFPF